jgi:hypothetical protein
MNCEALRIRATAGHQGVRSPGGRKSAFLANAPDGVVTVEQVRQVFGQTRFTPNKSRTNRGSGVPTTIATLIREF